MGSLKINLNNLALAIVAILVASCGAQNNTPTDTVLQITLPAGQQFSADLHAQTFPITIGQVQYTNSDPSVTLGFSLSGANASVFQIDQIGNLSLAALPNPPLPSYTLTVNIHRDSISGIILASIDDVRINLVSDLPALDFSAQIQAPTAIGRRTILFNPISNDLGVYSNWRWDFGDSSIVATNMSASHVYSVAGSYTVKLSAMHNSGTLRSISHVVYPHDSADPLRFAQWYLNNSGDEPSPVISRFAPTRPSLDEHIGSFVATDSDNNPIALAGENINLTDPIDRCGVLDTCRGEGIVVGVIDRGVQVRHPDLNANSLRNLSVNLHPTPIDPTDPFSNYRLRPSLLFIQRPGLYAHGTAVAGIIVARDLNGIGTQGIAPRAELASYNYLDHQSTASLIRAFTDENIDVSNNSWGQRVAFRNRLPSVAVDAVQQAITQGREGLGTVFVKATGNSGQSSIYPQYGNRHESGAEADNNLRYAMVVGGTLPNGRAVATSSAGANIRLNAYHSNQCYTRFNNNPNIANPVNIVSTDVIGIYGYTNNNPPPLLLLDNLMQVVEYTPPSDILDYTYCFSGASAATPMVSGAVALLLQQRPDLTWRDVQAILSLSARQNDSSDSGWQVNGAGHRVHHAYGFGVLDVDEVLTMAKTWQVLPAEVEYDSKLILAQQTITDCSTGCLPRRLFVPQPPTDQQSGTNTTVFVQPTTSLSFIESVVVELDIQFGNTTALDSSPCAFEVFTVAVGSLNTVQISLEHRDNNGALISSSLLHKLHPTYTCLNITELDWSFLSVHHFGEDIAGTWQVVITDFYDDNVTNTLNSWRLRIYGHNDENIRR